ncbi:MAG TPA: hypothetical protein VFB15_12085 [Candidatus Binataceae bacterium]|jgi:hypothetical protein|nr:hypothetical protein [Candidatus Binataceae bacterium]
MKRVCGCCARVIAVVERCAGRVGWSELVDAFAAEGLTRVEVDRVLDAEVDGAPTIRDRLTAAMTNVLMRGLGMPGRQTPDDVQRVRRAAANGAGTWSSLEKPSAETADREDADGR